MVDAVQAHEVSVFTLRVPLLPLGAAVIAALGLTVNVQAGGGGAPAAACCTVNTAVPTVM